MVILMYKIGDFSKMSKTTIKTLRYYENEGLLLPAYVDPYTSYRYYESRQLIIFRYNSCCINLALSALHCAYR